MESGPRGIEGTWGIARLLTLLRFESTPSGRRISRNSLLSDQPASCEAQCLWILAIGNLLFRDL